ncbi:MAG: DNRLRE domain-containing protein, partial [Clostridia bacterium]
MKAKKLLALILAVTLLFSVMAFSPMSPAVVAAKDTVRLLPSDDAFVAFSNDLLDSSNGDSTLLEIGYEKSSPLPVDTGYSGASRGDLKYARDILIKFDASGVDVNSVSSAVLRLYIDEAKNINSTNASSVNLAVFEADGDWSESSVTWNNAPEAGKLAAVSASVSKDNSSVGTAVEIDLTSYIRQNPKNEYSFRIKASAAGFNFHSKESGTSTARPVLEISTDGQLAQSEFSRSSLLEDTYAENSDDNRENPLGDSELMFVAADKTTDSKNGSLYTRNGYIKVLLPTAGESTHYDSAKIILRAESIANADQTVSLIPVSSDWSGDTLTWSSQPEISGEAAASAVVPNNSSAVLNYFSFDITDYVNTNPSEDGIYAFALTANTAVSHFYTSENENECYRPAVECIYRENAKVTLHYADSDLNDIAAAQELMLPVGQEFEPADYPMVIDEGYYFSSEATLKKNSLPYAVKKGENHVYLIYENKAISGFEEIETTTIQYEAPTLPDKMKVIFEGGSDEYFPVSWAEIDPANYAAGGSFTVMGTLQGIEAQGVTAKVTVLGITGVTVPTLSTAPGSYPALPETLSVSLEDGSSRDLAVEWDEVDQDSYAAVGSFVASGRIVLSGMPVQMTVLVEEGTVDDRVA